MQVNELSGNNLYYSVFEADKKGFENEYPEFAPRLKVLGVTEREISIDLDLSDLQNATDLRFFKFNRQGIDPEILKDFDKAVLQALEGGNCWRCNDTYAKMLVELIKELEYHFNKKVKIVRLNLSRNPVSGSMFEKQELVDLLSELTFLNYSRTELSPRGMGNFARYPKLYWLNVDACRGLNAQADKVEELPNITIVSAKYIEVPLIAKFTKRFPNLDHMYFTQTSGPGKRLLGSICEIDEVPITHAVLQKPCGHVIQRKYLNKGVSDVAKLTEKKVTTVGCVICINKIDEVVDFSPSITYLRRLKSNNCPDKWSVKLLDYNGKEISGKVFMHESCGHLFVPETLKSLYGISDRVMDLEEALIEELKNYPCVGCNKRNREQKLLNLTRVKLLQPKDLVSNIVFPIPKDPFLPESLLPKAPPPPKEKGDTEFEIFASIEDLDKLAY